MGHSLDGIYNLSPCEIELNILFIFCDNSIYASVLYIIPDIVLSMNSLNKNDLFEFRMTMIINASLFFDLLIPSSF